MIRRIVKLTFLPEHCQTFENVFRESAPIIRQMPGCRQVVMWRDVDNPCRYFTFSTWDDVVSLNAYRQTDFFTQTWAKTKALFAERPEAWSVKEEDS